ncbi:hypothetical protein KC335_g9744 [Hortaea werneckii]|nr:hypothetical protein KC352_g13273 [Hortaea werneckii]KAI7263480.1 hypothetical protein KC335_g9744 [Hortaea werneckii]KAI7402313.1 hypothetical protein KC336_g14441 [Hortaea werneckii]KAI7442590.1 hypothetical protein KC368_g9460 [Hortaea werneckii]KAI7458835.1 hypothetical protein KC364_g10259 [Hortaea werneckii]
MPRPNPPPTPGSSSDIRGKETDLLAPPFDLPPTAYPEQDRASNNSSTASSANGSDSSYRPASSGMAAESRKRSAPQPGPVITADDFTLPPPPTRSRKIIQMKPRGPAQLDPSPAQPSQGAAKTQTAGTQGGKRKQNATGQTAAGRKIARKTAHSLIERRRRSKMNEEFGVLKDMIPACQGQEMHKLAILQASIEYLRYLEQCISDLQAQAHSPSSLPPPSARGTLNMHDDDEMDDNDDEDEGMPDEKSDGDEESQPTTAAAPPTRTNSLISLPSLSQLYPANPTSPPIFSSSARHFSISSASQPSYSPYIHSNHASPAFGPQLSSYQPSQTTANHGNSLFGLGSPALKPLDSSPNESKRNEFNYSPPSGSSSSSNRNRNRDPTTLPHPPERATVKSEHLPHLQQHLQAQLHTPPSPPAPAAAVPSSPSSHEQDATSAAAVALSMLNSSTCKSTSTSISTSSAHPVASTSSPFFQKRRRRSGISDPPPLQSKEEEEVVQARGRDAGTGNGTGTGTLMIGGGWRPLPESFLPLGHQRGQEGPAGEWDRSGDTNGYGHGDGDGRGAWGRRGAGMRMKEGWCSY